MNRTAPPAARRRVEGAEPGGRSPHKRVYVPGLRLGVRLVVQGVTCHRIDAGTALNTAVRVAVEDRRITRIYVVANPQKLGPA